MRSWLVGWGGALVLGLAAAGAAPPAEEGQGLPPRFMPADEVPTNTVASAAPGGPMIQAVFSELKGQAVALPPGTAPEGPTAEAATEPGAGGEAELGEGEDGEAGDEGALAGVDAAEGAGSDVAARLFRELRAWQETRGALAAWSRNLFRALVDRADPEWLAGWHPSASVGPIGDGRLLFAVQMTDTPGIHMRHPELAYTVPEVIEHLRAAGNAVRQKHPGGMDLQIGDISVRKGGKLKPHFTHRHGRDVDLRYYLLDVKPGDHTHHFVGPDKLDCKRLWTFIDTLIARDAVNLIYIDYRLQKRLYDYAIKDLKRTPAELYPVLSWPKAKRRLDAKIQHAKNHFSHMHIRFKTPRSTFWGAFYEPAEADALQRKVDLATRGSYDYTVRKGDTLGLIAKKQKTTIEALLQANRMTAKSKLQLGQRLQIPVERPRRIR